MVNLSDIENLTILDCTIEKVTKTKRGDYKIDFSIFGQSDYHLVISQALYKNVSTQATLLHIVRMIEDQQNAVRRWLLTMYENKGQVYFWIAYANPPDFNHRHIYDSKKPSGDLVAVWHIKNKSACLDVKYIAEFESINSRPEIGHGILPYWQNIVMRVSRAIEDYVIWE